MRSPKRIHGGLTREVDLGFIITYTPGDSGGFETAPEGDEVTEVALDCITEQQKRLIRAIMSDRKEVAVQVAEILITLRILPRETELLDIAIRDDD